ncbi:MAG: sulfatase-like hydrolase/transferase [Saprospiraceae bacterium]
MGLTLLFGCQEQKKLPTNSPNFLVILADDLDYSEIGCYGGEIPTPHLDQLAKEGTLFTNFHTVKDDAKTKAMLLTGTSQALVPTTNELQKEALTISELLKEAGYRTLMSGKWNLGKNRVDAPVEKGFDQSFALMEETCNHLGNKRYFPAIFRANNNIQEISEDFYTTQYFTRQLLSFLSTNKKKQQRKPFFAYLSFTSPHYPLQAPPRAIQNFQSQYEEGYAAIYEERLANQLALGIHSGIDNLSLPDWDKLTLETQTYEAKKMEIYAAMVHEMDTYIGQVINYLKIAKQYENTIIIFLGDGGITKMKATQFQAINNSLDNLGTPNSIVTLGTNWESIKLGNKGNQIQTDFDNTLKAPLIISSPLLKTGGENRNKNQHTVLDITPTILKLIGLSHPSDNYFEDALALEGKPIF